MANGEPMSIPFRLNTDYNISPLTALEIGNTPPVLRLFDEKAAPIQGPFAFVSKAIARTASVATGLEIPLWADDDAKYSSGTERADDDTATARSPSSGRSIAAPRT